MSKIDFKKAVEQEEARLRLLHPTPEDIPGCVTVFDDYLACSGKREQTQCCPFAEVDNRCYSHSQPNEISISIWSEK
jgi:hypothetical protein